MPAALDQLWWGFSSEQGWVVLDRSIKCNEPPSATLLFFRCSDASVFSDERKRWKPPHYIFAPNYIKSLPIAEQHTKAADLEKLKSELDYNKIADLIFQVVRTHFFKKLSREDPGVRPATNRRRRLTHCYNCKTTLDSSIDVECNECGWLVCDCGACGCGYSAS